MKWLVTGAGGFLGSAIGEAAGAAGYDVLGIGRVSQKPACWPGKYMHADFASPTALAEIIREAAPDCLAHFAGTASVGDSFESPHEDFEGSTALWFRLLEAVRLSGLRPRIAFASSAAVYGSPEQLPTPETAPRRPESPYGFHKMLSETVAEEFATCFGLSVVSLRFFSVFGPRQRRLLVWELFEQLSRGVAQLRLKGTGDECRDFLPVEEAASAVVRACAPAAPGFQTLNVASGASVSVRDVAETLKACAGSDAEIVFAGEGLRGNPARWQADVRKLQGIIPDWEPMPFGESLASCVRAWSAAPQSAESIFS